MTTVNKPLQIDLGQGVTLEMVAISGGTFTMGSPQTDPNRYDDEAQHEVTVAKFWMGKYPVTQAQYQAIMGNNPAHFKGDKRPVESVSWNDAVEFCSRLSARTGQSYTLPTEAQWEHACRAGTTTAFHFGDTISPDLANFYSGPQGDYREEKAQLFQGYLDGLGFKVGEETTEVGSFPPNGFGLYDMHGNVFEWCLDYFHDSYQGAPTDGSAWVTDGDSYRHVLRGGSWFNTPRVCRSAFRNAHYPNSRYYSYGFRVVSAPPGTV